MPPEHLENVTMTPLYFPEKGRFLPPEHLEIFTITPLLSEKRAIVAPGVIKIVVKSGTLGLSHFGQQCRNVGEPRAGSRGNLWAASARKKSSGVSRYAPVVDFLDLVGTFE